MRVLVDASVFERRTQIGVWRIFYEVLKRIGPQAGATLWLRAPALQPLPDGLPIIHDRARALAQGWNVVGRLHRRLSAMAPPPAGVREATVFHSSYFTPCPVPGIPSVITVYDMVAESLFHTLGGWASVEIEHKRAAIKAATRCICISASTASDLVRFYPEVADRVRVVLCGTEHLAHGANAPVTPGARASAGGDEYALFVGSRLFYKNFALVLDAMAHRAWPRGLTLRIVGSPASKAEEGLIGALGLRDRIRFLGPLDDAALQREYQRANCFLFPSTFEGFGIPLLEAQVNGAPVVCSDIPVFREVAGASAVLFDPRLSDRLAEAVATLQDGDARRRCIEAGYENVRRFSWDRAAAETLAVYREVSSA